MLLDDVEQFNEALALGPLAIACLARDAGMPVEVESESEYLPKALLEFARQGEPDT